MSARNSVTSPSDGGLPPEGNGKLAATEATPVQRNRWGSVRVKLASLVMACVVPVWIAAGFLVYYNYQSRRALTEQRMLETARALTMVVDRELANIQASLSVLATTPSLVKGNLPAFYRRAQVVLETCPDSHIILSDATTQQLVNTAVPFGVPLPKRSTSDSVRQVFATGKPVITNVFKSAVAGRPRISVEVPVFRNGQVVYDLSMSVAVDRFASVLLQQHLPAEWVGRLFDGNHVIVARTRLGERLVGQRATPAVSQRIATASEGTVEAVNLENVRMFNSFSRSATSGWTVVIGVPKAAMMAEIWRWLGWVLAGTFALSFTGIMLALLVARRIAGSIQGLLSPALSLGRGEPVTIEHLDMAETNEVGESLVKASRLIQQRAEERERAESARRETEALKRFNLELKRSEADARASATELAAIMDATPAITFIAHDPGCQRVTCNRTVLDLLRLPPGTNVSLPAAEAAGRRPPFRMLQDGRELAPEDLPLCRAASTGREIRDCEYTLAFDDGSSRIIYGNAVPLLNPEGKVWGAVSAYIDITERKRAQEQLEATAERLRAILATAPIGINIVDHEGRVQETNLAFCHIMGYSHEEIIGRNFAEYTHPDDVEKNLELQRGINSGELQSYMLDKRFIRKDGSVIWARVRVAALNREFRVSTIADITEKVLAQEHLRRTAERLRLILEKAPVGIVVTDRTGRLVEFNPAHVQMCGYSAEELKSMSFADYTHPEDLARNLQMFNSLASDGPQSFALEKRYLRKDGETIWVRLVSSRLDQQFTLAIAEDITERKRAEQSLAESEERLRTIVELAPDGIFVIGERGQIIEVNQAACKQLRYTREQLLRLNISDIIAPRFRERAAARLQGKLPAGTYESAQIRADGVEIPVELSVTQIVFRQQPALIRITRDISDRKRAEEQRGILEQQLRQAQKMEAVGQLAGGIAHDFNNLLMVIQSYTEMLQDSLSADNRLRRNTHEILKAATRAVALTRQMLAFSRKQLLSPTVLDLNAVVEDAAKMLKRLIGADIEFRVIAARSPWAIEADSDQIVQVLMNLCVNARDAMPQGGTLTITTSNIVVGGNGVEKHAYVPAGEYVMLTVADTGTGISEDLQTRIFDPFFTTKEVGKGTGLGLSTVYGIVKQSGGYVWVDSEPGQGACFTICLPRTKRTANPEMLAKSEARPQGRGRILVAEDEGALREAVCDYLSGLGYTVFGAGSGQEALSLASEEEKKIDLLLTDLVMPKMSGSELSQHLGKLRPGLKTIYMSGYADEARMRQSVPETNASVLQKPFSLGTLARKVREALESTGTIQ